MSDREPLTPELKAVEAALASLAPTAASAAERDRLMFAAGRAAARPRGAWPQVVGTIGLAAAAILVGRFTAPRVVPSPEPLIAAPTVTEPERSVAISASASPSSYVQLRRQLPGLDFADAGPVPTAAPVAGPTSRQALLHELLN
jgi:hypothetical protein